MIQVLTTTLSLQQQQQRSFERGNFESKSSDQDRRSACLKSIFGISMPELSYPLILIGDRC